MYTCNANRRMSSSTVGNTMYIKYLMAIMYMYIYITNKQQKALLATTLVIYKLKECKILHEVYFVLKFIYFNFFLEK